ncbi:polygalacturonase-like [Silene latifolia]|uniref:polygalacturonase-like n=1 Tax=Silene latifolia TaxID=37657 RepID=UPI003D7719AC
MTKLPSTDLYLILTLITLITCAKGVIGGGTYNVQSLGGRPNGRTDSSKAFMAAWTSACGSTGRSTILVPSGRFLVRNKIIFSGNRCKSDGITFVIKGTILAPSDFRVLGNSGTWLSFENTNGVTLSGGVFDGQGAGLWACKRFRNGGCPSGVTTLSFTNSMNIVIDGVTSLNSQLYHIVFNGCKNVKVQGVTISASGTSPNTDGIHVQMSMGVTILNSKIRTGDDCISIGPGTNGLWIEGIHCGPGHGISIGSLGKEQNEPGVQNVTVKTCSFTNTQNGVRIKSWGRASNGFVRNVVFQHLTMVNSQNPIIIDQNYCPGNKNCPGQVSGVRIDGVTYQDIHGTSATPIAVKLDCSSRYHCAGIILEDVHLTYGSNKPASAFCTNAIGSTSGMVQPNGCL